MNPNTHLYLYAKGQYRISDDIMADLRVIVGAMCGCKVSEVDAVNILLGVMLKEFAEHSFEHEFIRFFWYMRQNPSLLAQVKYALSFLSMARVDQLDLGEADYKVLSLSNSGGLPTEDYS